MSRNAKSNTSNFYYSELANGGLTPPKKLYTVGIDQTFSNYYAYKEHAKSLQFNTSPNKKLVVKYNPGGADSKADLAKTATVAVFNEEMNTSWKKEFSLPSDLNKFVVTDVAINDNGEVFLQTFEFSYLKDKLSNFTTSLFILTKDGQSKYVINENQDKQCDANRIYIAPDNSAIVAGLYKDDNQYKTRQLGLFFAKYANKKIEPRFYPFTESYMASLRIYDEEVKNKCLESYESSSYYKFYPDGSFTFIAAGEYFITEFTSAGFIIPRFSSNGELLSLGKISRMLRNGRDINHPQSFAFLTKGDDMYILFNSMLDESGKMPKGGISSNICHIPETGSGSMETLFTNKDKDSKMILSSMFFLDLGNGKYLIRKAFDEKYHYGIVEL